MCGPRLLSTFDPEGDTFRYVRDNLTDVQLEAADGSCALMIVKTIRLSVGPKSIQVGVRLLFDFFRLDSLHWTRRYTLQYSKVGQTLNASNSEINSRSKRSLHHLLTRLYNRYPTSSSSPLPSLPLPIPPFSPELP